MTRLKIPHQFLTAHSSTKIDPHSQVICVSPEKLLDPNVVREMNKLAWSCICIDEPHLALLWGTTKSRIKPFRDAFSKLSRLNDLSTCFELHSATIFDEMKIFELLGRKNSKWTKQIQLPNRDNLTMYLLAGKKAPENIMALPIVTQAFDDEDGLLLIFVQRIADGSSIHLSLLEYCVSNGYIKHSAKDDKPHKPVAFLHSSLSEETKKRILNDAKEKKLRVLIATNAAGCGINIPVSGFVGWGLDPEPCGIIQAMGRTCRKPVSKEGAVLWVHNPRIHGRRIPTKSNVRDLLNKKDCLRKTTNNWFAHDLLLSQDDQPAPEYCCSRCMEKCADENDCKQCLEKLKKIFPIVTNVMDAKSAKVKLTKYLQQLNINAALPGLKFPYKDESLSEEIINHISSSNSLNELDDFIEIFSLGKDLKDKIYAFLNTHMQALVISTVEDESDTESDSVSSSSSEDPSESENSSEYFDDDDES